MTMDRQTKAVAEAISKALHTALPLGTMSTGEINRIAGAAALPAIEASDAKLIDGLVEVLKDIDKHSVVSELCDSRSWAANRAAKALASLPEEYLKGTD